MMRDVLITLACLATAGVAGAIGSSDRERPPTTEQVMKSARADDWRRPDPANTLYIELASGRVIIELAPRFAPLHVANIKQLVAQKYFDGLGVIRVQDNYVVQWGDSEKMPPNDNAARKIADETDHRDRIRRQARLDQAVTRIGPQVRRVAQRCRFRAAARGPRWGVGCHRGQLMGRGANASRVAVAGDVGSRA